MAEIEWDKVGKLLEEVREVPSDERATFLNERCEDDSVRKEVLSLLEAEEEEGGFFDGLASALPSIVSEEEPEKPIAFDPLDFEGKKVGHYDIEEHLGSGGMGIVYKARDPNLDRMVALKFLPPHLSAHPKAEERFLREARAASALEHPHIAAIYEIGETEDGRRFIAMSYYQGETLKEKIRREGPVPIEEAIGYAEQIAGALSSAHEAGIVHRDVKPANVMVTGEGEVKLLDFGLAKAAAETRLTDPGQQMGTAAYMSPEQAEGEEVDGRTDLWALGALLYEMLAGERPFQGGRSSAVIHAILHEAPTPLGERREDVPSNLERVVHCCLEKNTEERYSSAEVLLDDLQALEFESGPTVGDQFPRHSGAGTTRTAQRISPTATEESVQSEPGIAVLPFKDMSPEGDQQYFGDGLAEELLDALADIEGLRVAARTSSYAFRDDSATVQQIGEQLGVSHLLEGSVRKAGDQLRITAQLVDASDGYHVWSDTYDRTASDVFEIQDEITGSVVGTLEGILLTEEKESGSDRTAHVKAGTDDPKAHDHYLEGKYYWNHRSRFGLEAAIERFEEAIEVDPEFARPYAGLAIAYTIIAVYRLKPPDMLRVPTREAIDRALELEPDLAEAWHAEGLYRAFFGAKWNEAVSALRRAAELNPNSGRHAVWVGFLGLHLPVPPDDVDEQLSRAEEREPRSNYVISVLGLAAMLDRRYDNTIEFADRALEIEPEAFFSWFVKGVGHVHRGNGEAGLDALERMVELAHRTPFSLSLLGSAAAQVGRPERTRSILRELEARSEEEFVAPIHTGMLKAALGRVDEALQDLEQERAEFGAGSFTHLLLHIWRALEEDRRYREMLEEVGLRLPRE